MPSAECQNKKAAYLCEVVSVLTLKARIVTGRAEALDEEFDCVTMRSVDKMERAVVAAVSLLRTGGVLALLTTSVGFPRLQEKLPGIDWKDPVLLPSSEQRSLCLGIKARH